MLSLLTLLITGTATAVAQTTIQSRNGEFNWVCPVGTAAEASLPYSCRQQSASGAYELRGVQAYVEFPNIPPSDPFDTEPSSYNLECSYGVPSTEAFNCVYAGPTADRLRLVTGSNSDCPVLSTQQPSARAFNENSNRLSKRLDIPQIPICPRTGDNQNYYLLEPLTEIASRDPSQTGYFITCTYNGNAQCGYAADGRLLRFGGDGGYCPTNLCDPSASVSRKRRSRLASDPIASRQETASRLRRRSSRLA